jgi:hypothetical protein
MIQCIDVDEVSAAWLGDVLGYPVRSMHSKRIGTGQTGAACRIAVEAEQGPKSFVLKSAAGAAAARQRVSVGYRREVGFYSDIASTLDARVPDCWYAGIADDGLKFSLLFEDLTPRVPGVQVDGCSVEQAQAAIRNLSGLHAPRWNDATLFEHDFLKRQGDEVARAKFLCDLTRDTAAQFVERYKEALGAENAETMLAAAGAIAAWELIPSEPFSLIHGDYRLDNLMFGAESDDVVALDWQTLNVAPPGRDLAYFIANSLPTRERRQHEHNLVRLYVEELLERGVKDYDFERCFRGYRLGFLQAIVTVSIGCIYATGERTPQSDAMFLSMATRTCAAIRDLETLQLVETGA